MSKPKALTPRKSQSKTLSAPPAPYRYGPDNRDQVQFQAAHRAAAEHYERILPDVESALQDLKWVKKADPQSIRWSAETLANVIALDRHFQPGKWLSPRSMKEISSQILELADALERYRKAVSAFGLSASSFVWPQVGPVPDDGRKWVLGNDQAAHLAIHGLPPRLGTLIQHLRAKAAEARATNSTARRRPPNKGARDLARQAAFEYLQLTGRVPGFSGSTASDGGPYVRLVRRLFEIAEVKADPAYYAKQGAAAIAKSFGGK